MFFKISNKKHHDFLYSIIHIFLNNTALLPVAPDIKFYKFSKQRFKILSSMY